eukprot:CAMPEP_0172389908 /NCGR_PEP_ID=MMETSP1061-20121228/6690_1 /TAXON_ID=37318 /ORGANISM="Pseudo-nitzschia pungens, Strain cf. pungens" /LENGTH=134 /DNA_ID=CAMNT_0013120157 /DNA_START=126 /DNA_END=525 /DNA_ORIENTATION=-
MDTDRCTRSTNERTERNTTSVHSRRCKLPRSPRKAVVVVAEFMGFGFVLFCFVYFGFERAVLVIVFFVIVGFVLVQYLYSKCKVKCALEQPLEEEDTDANNSVDADANSADADYDADADADAPLVAVSVLLLLA